LRVFEFGREVSCVCKVALGYVHGIYSGHTAVFTMSDACRLWALKTCLPLRPSVRT